MKAYLELDEMPQSCDNCPQKIEDDDAFYVYCKNIDEEIHVPGKPWKINPIYEQHRHESCPLKTQLCELPILINKNVVWHDGEEYVISHYDTREMAFNKFLDKGGKMLDM